MKTGGNKPGSGFTNVINKAAAMARFACILFVVACKAVFRKITNPAFMLMLALAVFLFSELFACIFPIPGDTLSGYADSWRIYAKNGRLLREAVNRDGARARWVPLDRISTLVVRATIAVEDERFYSHNGIDWIAMGRAVIQNVQAGESVSGASTITMQLSRIMFGLDHSLLGKLLQLFCARWIERSADKDTILLNYLNRAPYGAGTVGIEAAGYRYFKKPGIHLSLAEAALLAGLPNSPSRYNPFENKALAERRQKFVLSKMLKSGIIDAREHEAACAEHLAFTGERGYPEAMHFTDYVLSLNPPPGEVHTTLDIDLNNQVEDIIRSRVAELYSGGMTNAAAVILDNKTGAILSMVGSVNYWDGEAGAVNGAISLRQPGSALKPFTYALALKSGFTPVSVLRDIKTSYIDKKGELYMPRNYTGKFYGPVLLAEALGRSLNVSAIYVLNRIGSDSLLKCLRDAGFASLKQNPEYYGLGLTLGNGEVTLLELAQGYALFARNGSTCIAQAVTSGIGAHKPKVLFPREICFLITDILSNEQLRMRAFGATNPLIMEYPMAIKTGTSSNWRDNWVIGYTEDITVAVWAGDFSGSPMSQIAGATGAGPLFRKIANLAIEKLSLTPGRAVPLAGVEKVFVCKASGLTPNDYCTDFASWFVLKGSFDRRTCNVHRRVLVDKRNGLLASSRCPEQYREPKIFTYLEPGYAEWQSQNGIIAPPTRFSPYCMPDRIAVNSLVITHPAKNNVFIIEPGYNIETQTLELKGEADPEVPEVEWIMDGSLLCTSDWPYNASWRLSKGKHRIYMKSSEKKSDPVDFEVR